MTNAPIVAVSFEDCRCELIEAGGRAAQQLYLNWRARVKSRPDYIEVISFVEGFSHQFLFTITEEMLEETKRRSIHALGELRKKEVEDKRIENFDTPFAIEYLFHMYIEERASVPTWQDWWSWLTSGKGKRFYVAKIQKKFDWSNLPEVERDHLKESIQWRLGKFYYSAFRELELFTKLRSRFNLPVKYHILADVLFRADLWMDRTVVSLFFGNPQYREGPTGRKQRPQYFLEPGFNFLEVTLPRQGYGKFWRVTDEDVISLAQKLQGAQK